MHLTNMQLAGVVCTWY